MSEENLTGKEFMDQSMQPSTEIDAALRPPSFCLLYTSDAADE